MIESKYRTGFAVRRPDKANSEKYTINTELVKQYEAHLMGETGGEVDIKKELYDIAKTIPLDPKGKGLSIRVTNHLIAKIVGVDEGSVLYNNMLEQKYITVKIRNKQTDKPVNATVYGSLALALEEFGFDWRQFHNEVSEKMLTKGDFQGTNEVSAKIRTLIIKRLDLFEL